jgi:Na+-transporting NADH:ubiquinone oxidoreductase subunit NqrF
MSDVHVQEVQVKTMSVEIRALTLNGKQMTLSVFKQLPNEDFYEWVSETSDDIRVVAVPGGIPWGFVRHHPDPMCRRMDPHHHIIWQYRDKLFRASLYHHEFRQLLKEWPGLEQLFIAV